MAEMQQIYNDALKIVLEAGKILLKGFESPKEISTKKSKRDFVTQYDKLVEKTIIDSLHGLYPHHNFIAEESAANNVLTNEPTWIIDPIDGTNNFIQGFPLCCISLALAVEYDLMIGIVYNPIINQLFTAQKGKGAFLNDKKINVSNTDDFNNAMIGYIHNSTKREQLLNICRGVRYLGSAAIELCYIAMGALDLSESPELKCWDVAAGVLIIQEAGGVVLHSNGDPYKDIMSTKLIVTCSIKLANIFLKL